MRIISILRSGVLAQQFCDDVAHATVEAVFARSLYLRADARFLCIGAPAIGNGPFTLIGELGADLGLRPGTAAAVSARHVTIGAFRFTLDRSEAWRAPAWPPCPVPAGLRETAAVLERRLMCDAPPEALARQPFGPARIRRYENRLTDIRGLIGSGPGLTPSGDDFLVGALATLDAVGAHAAHAALARAIIEELPGATSALSACFLRAAADRQVGEPLYRMVCAVTAGDVAAALAASQNVGHSSGWDMLAGITSTLTRIAYASAA